jgi:cytochrome c oxidase cbb3-type subunit 4
MFDPGLIKGLIAVITMFTFLGICWWAYRPGNRERFERDGLLAFADDELPSAAMRPPSERESIGSGSTKSRSTESQPTQIQSTESQSTERTPTEIEA